MEKLRLHELGTMATLNEDRPAYGEILAEELERLGDMSEGNFGIPPFLKGTDADKVEMVKTVLNSIKSICNRIAVINGIDLDEVVPCPVCGAINHHLLPGCSGSF